MKGPGSAMMKTSLEPRGKNWEQEEGEEGEEGRNPIFTDFLCCTTQGTTELNIVLDCVYLACCSLLSLRCPEHVDATDF